MILKARTHIQADPEEIFTFFEEMEENYEQWHDEHITFRWVEGRPLKKGSQSYFEEEIGGEVLKKTVVYSRVIPNRRIELQPTSRLMRLFLPRIIFDIEPGNNGCHFTQRIKIRTGPIGRRLNRDQFDAVHQHMQEEGENLKRMIETSPKSSTVAE